MKYKIKKFARNDLGAITQIFNYYIENSYAVYPNQVFTEFSVNQIMDVNSNLPKFVVKTGPDVVEFGFAYKYHNSAVFDRVAQFAYFILPEHTHNGLGKKLFNELERECRRLEVKSILVHISSLNEASLNFHKKNGFIEGGRFRETGKKFNKVFDDVWMQKAII